MSPLRERMIEDMILAGLALGTRQAYTQAVRWLAARYRLAHRTRVLQRRGALRGYLLLELRQQGAARGTFKIEFATPSASSTNTHSVLIGVCSGKKGSSYLGRSGCLMRCLEDQVRWSTALATSATRSRRTCLRHHVCVRPAHRRSHHIGDPLHRPRQSGATYHWQRRQRAVRCCCPSRFSTSWAPCGRTHRNRRWLFPTRCGDGPLNQRVLSHTFAAAADAAGLRHGVTSHALEASSPLRDTADREQASTSGSCRSCSATRASRTATPPSIPTSPHQPEHRSTLCSIG